jgi:phosphate starvation-inducible PhoH-like protein
MNFPKTPGQCKYALALRSQKPIVIGTGPAGSGKTMLACQIALEHVHKYMRP